MRSIASRTLAIAAVVTALGAAASRGADPLPSWNDTTTKKAVVEFVAEVTQEGGSQYVAPAERIAVFDNDGTLWAEQPLYVQFAFAVDRVKALAAAHPQWKEQQPFKAVLEGDTKAALSGGQKALLELIMASHAGMTTDEFEAIVRDWLATARHPRFKRLYTDLVYLPMLELLAYLRGKGFKTYVVSGGGVDFMRPWTERVYGIPPEQVIGSSINVRYELRGDTPILSRRPEVDFIDDKEGKPVAIHKFIGRRPIAAFGNSDGDYEMLRYVTAGAGPRLGLIVHHTDETREYAYDRHSPIGRLDRALMEAPRRGWIVVDMKQDWKRVFGFAN
jgi:hypothetical protein